MRKYIAFIATLLFINQGFAQATITGRVLNEEQEPLQGVTVNVGNLSKPVAVTDSLGNFSFSLATPAANLAFSYVGYVSMIVNTKANPNPTVILKRSNDLLSETVIRAFERNTNVKSVPAPVAILNRAALERFSNQSFVAAVNTVPGVKMDERSPGSYRISIRGNLLRSVFGVRNVKVYWNGIPFTDANGNTYINQLSLNNIGRIEVIKGPSGSLYGAGTGGVILLNSNISSLKREYAELQVSGGSYGMFSANASYNKSGKNNATLSFSHQQSDGYRSHTNMRRDVANYGASYAINSRQIIHANIFYSDIAYETPGGLTAAEVKANPRQSRPAAGAFRSAIDQKSGLYLKTIYAGVGQEYRFNSRWSNTTGLYGSYTDNQGPTIRNYEDRDEKGGGLRSVFQYKTKLLTVTTGGEYQYTFTNTATHGNRLGVKDTLQYHDHIDARLFNFFVQGDVSLNEDFVLNAGISYNNFKYGFRRLNESPSLKSSSNFKPQFIPRISLLAAITPLANAYVAVSKGYSPPSIDEIHAGDGNFSQSLKAETGTNYELGVKGDIIRNKLWIDVSYYFFSLENTLVSRRDSSGADFFTNAGKTKQKGIEASVNWMVLNKQVGFFRQLKLWSNYTGTHARFDKYQQGAVKFDGNKLTGTPSNVFVGGADLQTGPGIYGNFTYSYTGNIPLNDANTFFGTSYNLLALRGGYKVKLSKMITADMFVSYEKSFNNPYSLGNDLNAAGNRFYNPSAPEMITVGGKFQFNVK